MSGEAKEDEIQAVIERKWVDYLMGKPMKIDLKPWPTLDCRGYERDNGEGAMRIGVDLAPGTSDTQHGESKVPGEASHTAAAIIQNAWRALRTRRRLFEDRWFVFMHTFDRRPREQTYVEVVGALFQERGLTPADLCHRREFFKLLQMFHVTEVCEEEPGCGGGCGKYDVLFEHGYREDDEIQFDEDYDPVGDGTTFRVQLLDQMPFEIHKISNEEWMCCSGVSGFVWDYESFNSWDEVSMETITYTADEMRDELRAYMLH